MKQKYLLITILSIVCINIWSQTIEQKVKPINFTTIDSRVVNEIGKTNADMILYADSIIAKTIAWEGCEEEGYVN